MINNQILVLVINDYKYGVDVSLVEKVIFSVEVTPLLDVPNKVLGVVNLFGELIPVIDTRFLFKLPQKNIDIKDKFVVVNSSNRKFILIADYVEGLEEINKKDFQNTDEFFPEMGYIQGVLKIKNNILLIYNLENFINQDEQNKIENSINLLSQNETH